MSFRINTSFARVAVLGVATAFSAVPVLSETTPSSPAIQSKLQLYTPLDKILKKAGLSNADIVKARTLIHENMSRFTRRYISKVEMEAVEEKIITGIKKRLSDRPEKLKEAEKKLMEAKQKLASLTLSYQRILQDGPEDKNTLIDLGDKIVEAENGLEYAELFLRFAKKFQNISAEVLVNSGLNYALKGFDPHSAFIGPGGVDIRQEQGVGIRPKAGIGLAVGPDGRSKYFLKNGIKVLSVLAEQDTSSARKAGVKRGDIITHVDGTPVAGLRLKDVIEDKLKGKVGEEVALTIRREGEAEPLIIKVERSQPKLANVTYRIVDGDLGYIHVDQFNEHTNKKVREAIKKLQEKMGGADKVAGYIMSLRSNGGGLLNEAVALNNTFIDAGFEVNREYGGSNPEDILRRNTIVSTRDRNGLDDRFLTEPGDLTGGKPLVVLINGGSASASEIVAGTLQDYKRAKIVGIQSFGKGSVQIIEPAPRGVGKSKVTISYYYYGAGDERGPFGLTIQGRGITPDVLTPFVKRSDVSEAALKSTMSRVEGAERKVKTSHVCNKVKDFNVLAAPLASFDPRSGEYDFHMRCGVAVIREIILEIAQQKQYGVDVKEISVNP